MSEDTGVWAYAVTEDGHLSGPGGEVDLSWLTGVGETKVRTTTSCGLTVLVSDVSLAEFGEAALRENLENPDWLDEVAREHHYVIDAAARLFPLLPVRLATVYSDDAALCDALTSRCGALRAALRRVAGRVEWGVKAYPAPGADELGDDGAEPRTEGGAGLAQLRQRRTQLTAAREANAAAVSGARAVHAELAGKATDTRLHPPRAAQLDGAGQPMLLNAAYLLDSADSVTFTAAVAGQATAHPELRMELTGPWPPYSFAGESDDER
jgi:hypothetical protein